MGKMGGAGIGERGIEKNWQSERGGKRVSGGDEEEEDVHKGKLAAAVNDKKKRRETIGN